jgi:hypothetical protein
MRSPGRERGQHEVVDQVGPGQALERAHEPAGVEHVEAHRRPLQLAGLRLLVEAAHAVLVVERHHAVARAALGRDLGDRDRDARARVLVRLDELAVVHEVDVVARGHDDVLGGRVLDLVEVLGEGVGGAAVPVRLLAADERLEDLHPALEAVEVPGRPAPMCSTREVG